MRSFVMSAEIVVPLCILLMLGWVLHKKDVLSNKTLDEINNLCFRVLLPVALFCNVYTAPLSHLNNPRLILFAIACQLIILLVLFVVIPKLEKNNAARASLIQGIFRINFITFGFAIAASVGNKEVRVVVALLAAVLIPFYNLGSIFVLEHYCGGKGSIAKIFKTIITNPYVLAFLIALLFVLTEIKMPVIIYKTLEDISKMATPTSLIALGGCINFASAKRCSRQIAIAVLGRLIIIPAILFPVCILAGFRGAELLALLIMLISPTAVASYTMARTMGANAELSGHIVVFQSICSVTTIFLWLWFMGVLGYV